VIGLVRLAAENLTFPGSVINEWLRETSARFPAAFGEKQEPLFIPGAWNHEDFAGNPLHLFLIPLSLVPLIILVRKSRAALPILYALVILACYALLPIVIGHSITVWGVRYQLPFFFAWSPVAGLAFSSLRAKWVGPFIASLLILAALPWVLFNHARPIVVRVPVASDPPCRQPCLEVGGVFRQPRLDTLFANWREIKDDTVFAVERVRSSSCKTVGLRIDSHEWEYAIWWLLDAPQSGVRLQTLLTYPHLERLIDPSFRPCAILCSTCGDRGRVHGLDLAGRFGYMSVYLGSGFTSDLDG